MLRRITGRSQRFLEKFPVFLVMELAPYIRRALHFRVPPDSDGKRMPFYVAVYISEHQRAKKKKTKKKNAWHDSGFPRQRWLELFAASHHLRPLGGGRPGCSEPGFTGLTCFGLREEESPGGKSLPRRAAGEALLRATLHCLRHVDWRRTEAAGSALENVFLFGC